MPTIVQWLLPITLGALGRMAASYFSGPCPVAATDPLCSHWAFVTSIAGFVLGLFGFSVIQANKKPARPALVVVVDNTPAEDGQNLVIDEDTPPDPSVWNAP